MSRSPFGLVRLLPLAVLPITALGQSEVPWHQFTLDRQYECHDRFSQDADPYIAIETYSVGVEDLNDQLKDDVPEQDLDEAREAFTAFFSIGRMARVIISDTEFEGLGYQDGLDYRIDFTQDLDAAESLASLNYSLVIRADGDTAFYDFSDAESGEKIAAERLLKCIKRN